MYKRQHDFRWCPRWLQTTVQAGIDADDLVGASLLDILMIDTLVASETVALRIECFGLEKAFQLSYLSQSPAKC